MSELVGIDLGGTNIRGVRIDSFGRAVAEHRVPVGQDRTPEAIVEVVRGVVDRLGGANEGVIGVGIGVAAWLDTSTGHIHNAPNLGWTDVGFAALVRERLGRPAIVVNDLSAVTYGEWKAGAGIESTHLLCVFVGSGLGTGMVIDGALYEGACGLAGELGHIPVVADGHPCGCGRRGCLETYVGGRYLEARLRAETGDASITCTDVEIAYRNGNAEARARWEEAARWLAIGLTTAIQVLNPDTLVLGGGVMNGCPGYRSLTLEHLHNTCPPALLSPTRIVPPKLGDLSGAIGAALLARDRL